MKSGKNHILLSVVLLLIPFFLQGQKAQKNYTYRQYTTHDGLLQIQLGSAYQDDNGYLWFATKAGVSRFDGKSFTNFTKRDGLSNKVTYRVSKIKENICIVQYAGLNFQQHDGKFRTIRFPEGYYASEFLRSYIIFNEKEDKIYLFNLCNGNESYRHHFTFSFADSSFCNIQECEGERILETQGNYLFGERHIYHFKDNNISKIYRYKSQYYSCFTANNSGAVAYGKSSSNRTKCINIGENNMVTETPMPFELTSDHMFLMPDGRLLMHNNKSKELEFWDGKQLHETGIFVTLPTNFVKDYEGNTWVLSEEGAINLFSLEFEEYHFLGKAIDYVWNILEDPQGNMWFGGYGTGLWMMDKNGNISYPSKEQFGPAQKRANQYYQKYTKLFPEENYSWLLDIHKHLLNQYMGGCVVKNKLYFPQDLGLFVYENGKFDYFDTEELNGACFYVYYDEEADRIFSASPFAVNDKAKDLDEQKGLIVKDSQGIRRFTWDQGFIVCIEKDGRGIIRLGSYSAEAVWDGEKIITDTVPKPYRGIISMKRDKWGSLWKGTTDGVFVETDGKIREIKHEHLNTYVGSLLNYNDKYLLILCGYRLCILDLETFHKSGNTEITVFDYNNGFDAIETSQNGIFKDSKGYVWIANANNVIRVNPEILMSKRRIFKPKVKIIETFLSSDNIHFESIASTYHVLKPNENTLRFDYFSAAYSFPQSIRFRYRLNGLFNQWSEIQKESQAIFTNLSPGKYQFEVQSSIDGEHWSESAFSSEYRIQKPFWNTWWFYCISLLALIGVITFVVRFRQRKQTERLKTEKEINNLKLKAIRSKSIPHFSGNILSAISYMSMNNYQDTNEYIGLFSDFIKQTLRDSDRSIRPLSEELDYTKKYLRLEKLRFGNKFSYQIEVSPDIPEKLPVPNMILHTYCENAIKHGLPHKEGDGKLNINIYRTKNDYIIAVEDNGIGRQEALRLKTQGSGEGLRIILRQIQIYNKINEGEAFQEIIDLTDSAGNISGTRVEFHFPINYKFDNHV